jgi:alkylhydroperoxidase family enzyme
MTNESVIGVVARTGSAVAVALGGTAAAPRFLARREIGLVPPGLTVQPYHAAADMDLAAAGELIARVESAAESAAAAGLRALADVAQPRTVRSVAVVVKPWPCPGPGGHPALARLDACGRGGAVPPVFIEAERAALELTEQGTRIADAAGGVSDEVWANAAKHYDDDQLAALVSLIALINAYNRMNVIVQQPAGDYQPGMFG